jgi:GNAT superfamily N-acetyltransferase
VAVLAADRRRDYETQQPRFWRQADDALARHSTYLHRLVDQPDHVFLVAGDPGRVFGFVIGRLTPAPPVYQPGGLTCMVDDFAVDQPNAWASLGPLLLRDLSRAARARGGVQVVVVAGRHDEPKRLALQAAGLVVASEWWTGPISSA